MNKKQSGLLTLTIIALAVATINGVFDIVYNMQRNFAASISNIHGESVSVKIVAHSGMPSFLWYITWKVSGEIVTTVDVGVSITPTGINVANLNVTYYVKGVSGANSGIFLQATDYPATHGQEISNSTNSQSIDSHLSSMGLATDQDQNVNYVVYCKVEGIGVISGETLTAEVTEVQFDTISYVYGPIQDSVTLSNPTVDGDVMWRQGDNAYFKDTSEIIIRTISRDGAPEYPGQYERFRGFIEWDVSSIPDEATITNVVFKYHGYEENWYSEINEMLGHRPSTATNEEIYNEAGEGTTYFTGCYPTPFIVVGSNKQADLAASANTDLQNQLTADWFAIGLKLTSESKGNYGHIYSENTGASPKPTLYVEYEYCGGSSWFNLPLSVVSLPIGQQFLAILFMILGFTIWALNRERKRRSSR